MARIKKEQKRIFVNTFYLTNDGYRALEAAGIEKSLKNLQKLLTDESLAKYLDDYAETIDIAEARTKEAHVRMLEELFKDAVKRKDYKAVAAFSDRISKLSNWENTGGNELEIDLKISDDLHDTEEEREAKQAARDEQVKHHLQKDGLL